MIKVYQSISDPGRGDCMRATIASLLELELVQVPHFHLFKKDWWSVLYYFFYALGYQMEGNTHFETREPLAKDSINDFFYASVPSRNFKNCSHAVVMDLNGMCVHDPSEKGQWLGEDLRKEINYWYMFSKVEKVKT